MDVVLWSLAGWLALALAAAGSVTVSQPKRDLVAVGLGWVQDFSPATIKLLGLAQLAGAFGLVMPGVMGVPVLVPVTALGVVALMVGAVVVHARRQESGFLVVNAVVLLVAVVVAWGRLGPYPLPA